MAISSSIDSAGVIQLSVSKWTEYNGVSQAPTYVDSIMFGNIDSPVFDLRSYSIRAGTNSYTKFLKIRFYGYFTAISNIKLWLSSGVPPTGVNITFEGMTATYSTPDTLDAGDANIPTSEPATNINGTIHSWGEESVYLRFQLHTSRAAVPALLTGYQLTLVYDIT